MKKGDSDTPDMLWGQMRESPSGMVINDLLLTFRYSSRFGTNRVENAFGIHRRHRSRIWLSVLVLLTVTIVTHPAYHAGR